MQRLLTSSCALDSYLKLSYVWHLIVACGKFQVTAVILCQVLQLQNSKQHSTAQARQPGSQATQPTSPIQLTGQLSNAFANKPPYELFLMPVNVPLARAETRSQVEHITYKPAELQLVVCWQPQTYCSSQFLFPAFNAMSIM